VRHQLRREGRTAHERVEEMMAFCTAHGFEQLLTMGEILQGWALAAVWLVH
jgi:hypothetical protein